MNEPTWEPGEVVFESLMKGFRALAEQPEGPHDGKCDTATDAAAPCGCVAAHQRRQPRYQPGKVYATQDHRAAYVADAKGNLRRCVMDQTGNLLIRTHKPTKAERKAEKRARRS